MADHLLLRRPAKLSTRTEGQCHALPYLNIVARRWEEWLSPVDAQARGRKLANTRIVYACFRRYAAPQALPHTLWPDVAERSSKCTAYGPLFSSGR